MFQQTRRRLALWYTAVTAVLLLIFASGFYLYVRQTLIERVDDTLHHVVEVVERSLIVSPTSPTASPLRYEINVDASFRSNAVAVEEDRIEIEWFSPNGTLLWSTFSEPLTAPIHLLLEGETVKVRPNYILRQLTQRLEYRGDILGYLRVSHPWFEVAKPTRELMVDLAAGISLMIGFVAAAGWFLSGLAIEPIRASYQYLRQFTADASHELRNPLALIQTTVQVALSDPDMSPTEQRQQFEVVERLTRRLGNLVNDLLFLARQDSGMITPSRQPCPLDALLMEVVEEQTPAAAAKHIRLLLDLGDAASEQDEEPFTLTGDYDQLARLFTNLVSNGLQHTPEGGQVRLKLEQLSRHGETHLQVLVHDTGSGIPDTALPHVFERFYRVDPARPRTEVQTLSAQRSPSTTSATSTTSGTGLGLAIAKAICETHKGQIRVESPLGQGTTFRVTLPQRWTAEPLSHELSSELRGEVKGQTVMEPLPKLDRR
jgi:two-component system, OmpR family, manganese sensing sensor histidine kinase